MPVHAKDKSAGKRKTTVEEVVSLTEHKGVVTELRAAKKELERYRAQSLNTKLFLEKLKEDLRALPKVRVLPHKPGKPTPGHVEDQILLFSDAHAGERIEAKETDGFNEYNFEIMCNRIWKMMEKVLLLKDLQENGIAIENLWVCSLGDIVTGEIHNMAETNDLPILSTIQQTALIIAQMLLKFASAFKQVNYIGIPGNHDRRHEKPRTKQSYDNWGMILNWCVSLLCRNQENIKFLCPKSPFIVQDIRGWKWLLRHGHGKSNSFAGIPFYGISKKHSAYQELYRKRGGFDYEAMGHYHQQTTLKDDRLFINGSIVGANEFAIHELAAYSPPSQKLLGIDQKHGVTYTYKIHLDEASEHGFVYDPENVFEHQSMMRDFISTQFDSTKRGR